MEDSAAHLSAVILAGGKSSRFGKDKAGMEISGERVLDRLIELVKGFPFRAVAVVFAATQEMDLPPSITILRDDQEGLGPIGGLATAMRHLPGGILVTACDMPLVSSPLVKWLLDHYDANADAVIARHQGGVEPLFGIYEKSFLPAMEEAIKSGRYALHVLLEAANVRFVDAPDRFGDEFVNVNTPEDYIELQKAMAKKT